MKKNWNQDYYLFNKKYDSNHKFIFFLTCYFLVHRSGICFSFRDKKKFKKHILYKRIYKDVCSRILRCKKNHNYFPHLPIGSYCEDLMKNTPSMKHFNDVCTNCISVPFGIFEKTSTIALVFQKFTMYAS